MLHTSAKSWREDSVPTANGKLRCAKSTTMDDDMGQYKAGLLHRTWRMGPQRLKTLFNLLWVYFKDSLPHKSGSIFLSATKHSQALKFYFWVHMVLVVWKHLEYTASQQAVQSVQYGWSKQSEPIQQSQTLFVGRTLTLELQIITTMLISFLFSIPLTLHVSWKRAFCALFKSSPTQNELIMCCLFHSSGTSWCNEDKKQHHFSSYRF